VAAVVVAVPASRAAVARLLGVGGVGIVTVDDLPEAAGPYDLGEPLDVADAVATAPGPLVPGGTGPPDAAYGGVPDGAVSVVWRSSDALPPIGDAPAGGAGLVVTAWRTRGDVPSTTKFVGPGTDVEATAVAGRPATWISGEPHALGAADPSDPLAPGGELRVAGNTLLWSDGGVTYRLESGLDRDAARALAAHLVTDDPG
jgi:hypothetical protein